MTAPALPFLSREETLPVSPQAEPAHHSPHATEAATNQDGRHERHRGQPASTSAAHWPAPPSTPPTTSKPSPASTPRDPGPAPATAAHDLVSHARLLRHRSSHRHDRLDAAPARGTATNSGQRIFQLEITSPADTTAISPPAARCPHTTTAAIDVADAQPVRTSLAVLPRKQCVRLSGVPESPRETAA